MSATEVDREAANTRLAKEENRIAWVAEVLLDRIQWCIWADATREQAVEVIDGINEMTEFDDKAVAMVTVQRGISNQDAQDVIDTHFATRHRTASTAAMAAEIQRLREDMRKQRDTLLRELVPGDSFTAGRVKGLNEALDIIAAPPNGDGLHPFTGADYERMQDCLRAASATTNRVAMLAPAEQSALAASIAELEAFERDGTLLDEIENWASFGESVMLCLHELKRLRAAGADRQADKRVIARLVQAAEAIGFQAGVGERETAGAIVSYLATSPNEIAPFVDGTLSPIDFAGDWISGGCLSWHAADGRVVRPAIDPKNKP
ncbi:hypothetical protein [Sphingomonas azotifigens]|uniref:hypothetical protein n=1 Tax=Sphingomonas azotifigens TaxID=330920 RepID=UPI00111C3B0E|nr:hypothetical protein [Sphingomonas azotifigens]